MALENIANVKTDLIDVSIKKSIHSQEFLIFLLRENKITISILPFHLRANIRIYEAGFWVSDCGIKSFIADMERLADDILKMAVEVRVPFINLFKNNLKTHGNSENLMMTNAIMQNFINNDVLKILETFDKEIITEGNPLKYPAEYLWSETIFFLENLLLCNKIRLRDIPYEVRSEVSIYKTAFRADRRRDVLLIEDIEILFDDICKMDTGFHKEQLKNTLKDVIKSPYLHSREDENRFDYYRQNRGAEILQTLCDK
ncbi:hypothetical protein AGMMS49975_09240 [Clostridia bacterium]|nr:hypothetical protein AGMMS49975_09240 [Clostridia bacterium]